MNSANEGCRAHCVGEETQAVLSLVSVEGGLLTCSKEPVHGVSVPEPKPYQLH